MIKGLHYHISDGKYGFRTELLSVMYLNSVTVFFPTLLLCYEMHGFGM